MKAGGSAVEQFIREQIDLLRYDLEQQIENLRRDVRNLKMDEDARAAELLSRISHLEDRDPEAHR